MKKFVAIAVRSLIIMSFWSGVGFAVNLFSPRALPWTYVRPPGPVFSGVSVPFVDEREALNYLDDPATVFVDTRKPEHYAERHVRGAVSLPASEKEDRFPLVQPMLPEENRLVLYCYGPDCEDAEHVAEFLVEMGYKNMVIMSPGFPQWQKEGYPMEGRGDKGGTGNKDSRTTEPKGTRA